MNRSEILEKIGLNKQESSIYLALLDLGPSIITKIAEKTGLHRPVIYKILPILVEKRLVTENKVKKHMVYTAEPPNRIEAIFEDLKHELFNLLPELEDAYVKSTKKLKVRFLEGKDGTKRVFDDIVRSLPKGATFYRYSSNSDGVEEKDTYVPRAYRNIRDAKKLERQVITNKVTAAQKEPRLDRFVKVMPADFGEFNHNVTHLIYGDKIAFIDYNSETAVILENKKIADFQKHIFQALYKKI
jgi:sugar-specific transcriptional regulator TrmB